MNIHNIYSDCMLALANYINENLSIKIKNFQFNLANVSFSLKLTANYELPSAIISLGSITPLLTPTSTFHRLLSNKLEVSVLYNKTKDIDLLAQEQLYTLGVNFIINCESQIQALNIHYNLINILPLNKLMMYFSFISFFEIDSIYLNKYVFDTDNDQIYNLFVKHNKNSDTVNYCYSVRYEPLIKLVSSQIEMGTLTSSSFQVANDFEIITHVPVSIKAPMIDYSSNSIPAFKPLVYTNVKCGVTNSTFFVSSIRHKASKYIDYNIVEIDPNTQKQHIVTPNYSIDFELNTKTTNYKCEIIHKDTVFSTVITEEYDFIGDYSIYYLTGELSGKLTNVEIIDNTISGWASGFLDNIPLNERLVFYIRDKEISYNYSYLNFISNEYELLRYKIIYNLNNHIYDFIIGVNKYAIKLDHLNTILESITIKDGNELETILVDTQNILNGIIEFTYNLVTYSIFINICPDTLKINLNPIYPINNNITLISINFSKLQLNYIYGLNPGYIDNIFIDFNYNNEAISSTLPFNTYPEILYANVNFIVDNLKYTFDNINKLYTIRITPSNYIDININNLKWRFIHKSKMIHSDAVNLQIRFKIANSTSDNLVFEVDETLFMDFFVSVNKFNPMFCIFS